MSMLCLHEHFISRGQTQVRRTLSTHIVQLYPPSNYTPPCLYTPEENLAGWGNFGNLGPGNPLKMVDFQRKIARKECEKGKFFRACGGLTENNNKRV